MAVPKILSNRDCFFATSSLYALLLFCGVAPLVGLKVVAVLVAQIFTGGEIYSYFRNSRTISFVEYTIFGFSFGALTWLIFDQVFISLSMPNLGWSVPLVLGSISRLTIRKNRYEISKVDWRQILWIFSATLLGLSGEWVWTLPIASLAVLILVSKNYFRITSATWSLFSVLLIGLTAIATLIFRPKFWWISHGDTQFYEGLSKSLAKWGWQESVFSAGFTMQYHWFPYAWSGLVTRVSDSPDWVVLTRIGVLIPALCLVSSVWIISSRLSNLHNAPIAGVLIFSASCVFGEWFVVTPLAMIGSFSHLFATIWLFPVLIWAIDNGNRDISKSWLYLSISFIGLVGGKVSHAAVAGVFVFSYQVFKTWQDRKISKKVFFESISVLLTILIVSRILFSKGGSLGFRPLAWAAYLQGDLYAFYGRSLWLAGAILALGMVYLSVGTLIFGFFALKNYSAIRFSLFVSLLAGIGFSNLSSGPVSPNGLFFLHTAVIMTISISGSVLTELLDRNRSLKKREIWLCILFVLIALLTIYLIPNYDSGANSAIWLRVVRSLIVLIPLILLAIFSFPKKSSEFLPQLAKAALFSAATMSITVFALTNGSSFRRDIGSFKNNEKIYLPSDDLIELKEWLDLNSDERDIYASNYVCEGQQCDSPQLSQRALLSTTIERRALIESPWIASAFTKPLQSNSSEEISKRLEFSAEFAQNPTQEIQDFFKSSGVRWYVVDLTRRNYGRWVTDPANVFSNRSFVLIDLNRFEN